MVRNRVDQLLPKRVSLPRTPLAEQTLGRFGTTKNISCDGLQRYSSNPSKRGRAFLPIRVKEAEQDFSRFHWSEDEMSSLHTLRFTRVLFGLAPSPYLLYGVIESHLDGWSERHLESFVRLCKMLRSNFVSGVRMCHCWKLAMVRKTRNLQSNNRMRRHNSCV